MKNTQMQAPESPSTNTTVKGLLFKSKDQSHNPLFTSHPSFINLRTVDLVTATEVFFFIIIIIIIFYYLFYFLFFYFLFFKLLFYFIF